MIMKKLAIAGFVSIAVSSGSFAATCAEGSCDITATNAAQNVQYTAGTDKFVVNSFAFSVSSNVGLKSTENSVSIAVGTASSKGRIGFSGSSNGGSVTSCGAPSEGSDPADVPELNLEKEAGCAAVADL